MKYIADRHEDDIKEIGDNQTGPELSRFLARLYSQHTRIRSGGSGLPTWQISELKYRLIDAQNLLIAGLSISDTKQQQKYLRRAAEIFEWCNSTKDSTIDMPMSLLSAALYQLSNYPARALGVLNENHQLSDNTSKILKALLCSDFPKVQECLKIYWKEDAKHHNTNNDFFILNQIIRSIGVIVSWKRWGTDNRISEALSILQQTSKLLVYNDDSYSWLLSLLFARIAEKFVDDSLWNVLKPLKQQVLDSGKEALDRYVKVSFLEKKILAWPSQKAGVEGIVAGESFALCTPTGSGKTRIAELTILCNLFSINKISEDSNAIILYLAPSRALSAEVESVISRSLQKIDANEINVTAFYGGNDFGPSDITNLDEKPTILISTHEKVEALLRFYGPKIIRNICCVIIDEAHIVSHIGNRSGLISATSRALKLEYLVSRLRTLCSSETIFVALSAVAAEIKHELSGWMKGEKKQSAISPSYRSTRQLLGKLICHESRNFTIEYDVLDGQRLTVGDKEDTPYIPTPFAAYPKVSYAYNSTDSADKKMRAHLLWAALNFAQKQDGKRHSVLISITEHIEWYSGTFVDLLERDWNDITLPDYFEIPQNSDIKELYSRCLDSCEDYFGKKSREYKLLSKGIIVHHGKMPNIMSRLLIQLIQTNSINIVLATSTLSEGVNLPFETVLIPSILRGAQVPVSSKEMANVAGRAGRPGISTEGRTLILHPEYYRTIGQKRTLRAYNELIKVLVGEIENNENVKKSPLLELIEFIAIKWNQITNETNTDKFIDWLENVTYIESDGSDSELYTAIDSFDHFLLNAIEEAEELDNDLQLEDFLGWLWNYTFAKQISVEKYQDFFKTILVKRGKAVRDFIYKEKSVRHEFYHIGLPPRDCILMQVLIPEIKSLFHEAKTFINWSSDEKIDYIIRIIKKITEISSFTFNDFPGNTSWKDILSWWISPTTAEKKPSPKSVSKWYSYSSQNFIYKMNWAIGSILGYILESEGGNGSHIEKWKKSEMPWVILWLKDLITWGTLDPIIAYLMSKKQAYTRKDAATMAEKYWEEIHEKSDNDLDPQKVMDWLEALNNSKMSFGDSEFKIPSANVTIELLDDFSDFHENEIHVLPLIYNEKIEWIDFAGYVLAKSKVPDGWGELDSVLIDFLLNPRELKVYWKKYI